MDTLFDMASEGFLPFALKKRNFITLAFLMTSIMKIPNPELTKYNPKISTISTK